MDYVLPMHEHIQISRQLLRQLLAIIDLLLSVSLADRGCDGRSDGPRDTASARRETAGRRVAGGGMRLDQSFNYSSSSGTRCHTPAKGRWIPCSETRPLIRDSRRNVNST